MGVYGWLGMSSGRREIEREEVSSLARSHFHHACHSSPSGVIMAALGMETSSGDFEVIDVCFAGMPDLTKPEAGPSGTNGTAKGKEKAKDGMEAEGGYRTRPALTSR